MYEAPMQMHTFSQGTSVGLNQQKKKCQTQGDSMQTLATNSKAATAFSPELWHDVAPCNLPSVGARRAVRPAFLCLPTATHESFGHSCSRWGEMSPRWQSVLCVCVCLGFLPHERVLLLYKWPESHPHGNVGKTIAGWWAMCGCSLLYVKACWLFHRAAGMHWTCVYSCLHMHKTSSL